MVRVNRPSRLGGGLTLHLGLRSIYLMIPVLLLFVVMPIGHASGLLALSVAADLGIAALMLLRAATGTTSVMPLGGDTASLALLRRTVPELRMRRPFGTVEAQVRWRQTAQSHRRRREAS